MVQKQGRIVTQFAPFLVRIAGRRAMDENVFIRRQRVNRSDKVTTLAAKREIRVYSSMTFLGEMSAAFTA